MPRSLALLPLLILAVTLNADDPSRVFPPGEKPKDARLGKLKTLNDYFPMTVPKTKAEWEKRAAALREQVLVSQGLWPMPVKTPLNPVVHGKIDRDDYTVEKVFFSSLPGHYVTGNLYRPKASRERKLPEKLPAILCPHGHWANGRFFDAGEAEAQNQIKQGAEKFVEGGRYPLQARCVQLARMGCVVFFYDMIGYADSKAIGHRAGFTDVESELWLQSEMGLQTWNSIRALDFLISLPEVDEKRIGVTGASGGGTQTFMLGAIDPRPAVAFPAVMVSTAMQGGCICENCSYLRIDAGNIDLAGLFAPRPLAMSGAKDWTIDIETKGLPELKALYKLYDAEDKVMAKCYPQFGHNYNQVARELMYGWMNRHLKLGHKEPIEEKPFKPVPPAELSVFDTNHPTPKDAKNAADLRKTMTEAAQKQLAALMPKDEESLKEHRRVIGTALRMMAGGGLPAKGEVVSELAAKNSKLEDGIELMKRRLKRKGGQEDIPVVILFPPDGAAKESRTNVVWVDPRGKASLFRDGKLVAGARKLLLEGHTIVVPDVFGTGELSLPKNPPVDARFAGYTFGYNSPLLSRRIHDILLTVADTRDAAGTKIVHLVGFGEAGPWVLMARALCGDAVARTAVDVNGFRFDSVRTTDDAMMLPGALEYGGLSAFAALAAPGELLVHNHRGTGLGQWLKPAYDTAKAKDRLRMEEGMVSTEKVLDWVLRK